MNLYSAMFRNYIFQEELNGVELNLGNNYSSYFEKSATMIAYHSINFRFSFFSVNF